MNKKLIIIGSSIIGLIVLLLLVIWLLSLFKKNYLTYDVVEGKIDEATKKYYKNNPSQLPTEDGEYSLQYQTLVDAGYIKPLNELLKNGDSCNANISVVKDDLTYSYFSYLNCPGSYETKELYKVLTAESNIVTEGSGLYHYNNEYYYRGEVTNNYILVNAIKEGRNTENIYGRIIGINPDNSIKVLLTTSTVNSYPWDNRYNSNINHSWGYNDFEVSRLKETLQSFENGVDFITPEVKSKLVEKNLCIGKRSLKNKTNNGSVECAVKSKDKYLYGLLSAYEFMRVSLDSNCKTILNGYACGNYNYLASYDYNSYWTLTTLNSDSYTAYLIDNTYVNTGYSNNKYKLYLTINYNNHVLYKSGTGTESDPYIIKGVPVSED